MPPLINGPSDYSGPTRPVDFIRHGSTAYNSEKGGDRIRGWVDVPLDDRGKQEAQKVGQMLCKAGKKPDFLVSSDLHRSVETAQIIHSICGIPLMPPLHGMRPWNLGSLQGQESSKVHPDIGRLMQSGQQAPGGGESFKEFEFRFLRTLRILFAQTRGRPGVISHHRNERLLAAMEKNNWGSPDVAEFLKKGDIPGAMRTFNIPENLSEQGHQGGGQLPPRQTGLQMPAMQNVPGAA